MSTYLTHYGEWVEQIGEDLVLDPAGDQADADRDEEATEDQRHVNTSFPSVEGMQSSRRGLSP